MNIIKPDSDYHHNIYKKIEAARLMDNSQWRFRWKKSFTGYTDRIYIIDNKGKIFNKLIIYDITDNECYYKMYYNNDLGIVDAINEAKIKLNSPVCNPVSVMSNTILDLIHQSDEL